MEKSETFESLLRALRVAWLRGCRAAALQYKESEAAWMAVSQEGGAIPQRAVFRPPHWAVSANPETLEMDWAELFPRRWMRPASLSVSFDCELRQRQDLSWELFIVHQDRKTWWPSRPQHHVEIEIHGQRDGGGVVRFDGHLWRTFGSKLNEREP